MTEECDKCKGFSMGIIDIVGPSNSLQEAIYLSNRVPSISIRYSKVSKCMGCSTAWISRYRMLLHVLYKLGIKS